MGCCQSRQEAVSRCKARRRYTKHLVQARRDMAAAHAIYLRALRAALLQFASAEADHLPHLHCIRGSVAPAAAAVTAAPTASA